VFCVDDEMVCSNIYQVGGCVAVTIADRQVGESWRAPVCNGILEYSW